MLVATHDEALSESFVSDRDITAHLLPPVVVKNNHVKFSL